MKTTLQLHRSFRAQPPRSLAFATAMLLLLGGSNLRAHEDLHTHPALTVGALLFLDRVHPEDGSMFRQTDRTAIRQGSIDEDACPNYASHFYNPKTGENLSPVPPNSGLGLPGTCVHPAGFQQQTAPARASDFWTNAIWAYRGGSTSLAFTRLGHVFHLLQDMTSPAHVHNDIHAEVGVEGCQDGDDFENWGWSPDCGSFGPFANIYTYLQDDLIGQQLKTPLLTGLQTIFRDRPQEVPRVTGQNIAYTYVTNLAHQVYDFTTFHVRLYDTWDPFNNDVGTGELSDMFAAGAQRGVEESGAQWWLNGVGYSSGECGGAGPHWWLMAEGCVETGDYLDEGKAYIENTGGGDGGSFKIPDSLIPWRYPRDWYRSRYGVGASNPGRNSMLRIYGDVLYTAAVAYGAGLLQAFLDEAVMPRPVTQDAVVLGGGTARLHGRMNPGGVSALTWFEWGIGTNYNRSTNPQTFSSDTNFLSVSDSITGLLPETTYSYRLVSSNQYGIRHGVARTLRTLNFSLLAGGVNAWQITDDLTQPGSTLVYVTNLTAPQRQAATNSGWRFRINSRLTTDFGSGKTMNFAYGTGSRRFLVWLDLDANGNLIADLDGAAAVPLTTNGIGATLYHTNEIRYTNGTAQYYFDGALRGTWGGTTNALPAGQVSWGAGSSNGMGQMNFHQVRFDSLGITASYDAGSAGNPPDAPDPVDRGWMRIAGTNAAGTVFLSEHSISPDGEPFVPAVETLPATNVTISTARLNGQVDPHGDATAAWFEWGTTTSYGDKAPVLPRAVGSGQGPTDFNEPIGGLSPSTVYHYRVGASNGFGIRLGNDQTFQTASYLITGNLPNAWQITDNSTATGSTLHYTTNLTVPQQRAATNSWRFTVTSRLLTDFGANQTMIFGYGNGAKRYSVWLDFDANTNLTALLDGQTVPRIVVSNTAGATLYHTHELAYTNQEATYRIDGVEIARWSGLTTTLNANQVFWGAGASGGRGQMNFRRVEFQVGSSNVVAIYDSGTQDNPGSAPTNRWTRIGGTAAVIGSNVTEQLELFLPTVDTLAATTIGSTSAQLNGRVNARGQQTATWFEWGTRTSYGIRTLEQDGGAGFEAINASSAIAGLAVDTTYHFRVVASNSIATSFGADQTFRTAWFTDAGINLPSVNDGSVAWGDYDNDGDLDLLLTGQTDAGNVSRIYRNNGGGSFAQISTPMIGIVQSSAAWGDYDRDGDLDILLSGLSPTGAVSHVYRNDSTNFTGISAGLPGLITSSVAWVDFDNDGDLDILLTGADDATNRLARIYRNDGGTTFADINAGFAGTSEGGVTSGDFDGDGDHDFILTGLDSSGTPSTRYYRNDGGVFASLDLNLPGIHLSSVAAADYDNDGDLDLLLSGSSAGGELTRLFRNVGNGPVVEFEEVQTTLANVSSSSVAWADFDNDGDPDIALSGWRGGPFAALYRNDGQGVFVPLTQELTGLFSSSTAWGDVDNDGDVDLLLTGRSDQGSAPTRALRIYRNVSPVANTGPTAPSGLAGSGIGTSATVNWQPAIDAQTPPSALTYNLVLSSVTNGIDLASPMADTANGYRRVTQFGSAGNNHSWKFTGLTPGRYYFSVQAIDSAYAGGLFAPWQSFEVAVPPVVIIESEILQPGRVRIHFGGNTGTAYEVWGSSDLQTWTRLGPGVSLSADQFEYIDNAAPQTHRFYQIRTSGP